MTWINSLLINLNGHAQTHNNEKMNPITRSKIQGYLESHVENNIEIVRKTDSYQSKLSSPDGISKPYNHPFYSAIVPESIREFRVFEQMMHSTLEHTFISCAYYIAQDYHEYAERDFRLTGPALVANLHEVHRQLTNYEENLKLNSTSDVDGMVQSILTASGETSNTRNTSVNFDLYIRTKDKAELFFQFVPPQLNPTTYLKAIQNILHLHLLRDKQTSIAQTYIVIASNPDSSERGNYPSDGRILFGDEFWSLIGGPGAYQELLEIYQYVGKVKSKSVVDALAFGF